MSVYSEFRACSDDGFCGWVANPLDLDNNVGVVLIDDNGKTRYIPIENLELNKAGMLASPFEKLDFFVESLPVVEYHPPQDLKRLRYYELEWARLQSAGKHEEIKQHEEINRRIKMSELLNAIRKDYKYDKLNAKLSDSSLMIKRGVVECYKLYGDERSKCLESLEQGHTKSNP